MSKICLLLKLKCGMLFHVLIVEHLVIAYLYCKVIKEAGIY